MLSMLLAYDADGNVVATSDITNQLDADGHYLGTVDYGAHEAAGGQMTDIWAHDTGDPDHPVKGSKTWPEWIGGSAHQFRVELDGPPGKKHIAALVHKDSGHRRERAQIDAAIQARIDEKKAEAKAKGHTVRAAVAAREKAAKLPKKDQIAQLIPDPDPEPADIRDIVGGPGAPLILDDQGRSLPWVSWAARQAAINASRPVLPLVGAPVEPTPVPVVPPIDAAVVSLP